jgi:hypothetical protein
MKYSGPQPRTRLALPSIRYSMLGDPTALKPAIGYGLARSFAGSEQCGETSSPNVLAVARVVPPAVARNTGCRAKAGCSCTGPRCDARSEDATIEAVLVNNGIVVPVCIPCYFSKVRERAWVEAKARTTSIRSALLLTARRLPEESRSPRRRPDHDFHVFRRPSRRTEGSILSGLRSCGRLLGARTIGIHGAGMADLLRCRNGISAGWERRPRSHRSLNGYFAARSAHGGGPSSSCSSLGARRKHRIPPGLGKTVSSRFDYDPKEPDPFVSTARQAERDAFDSRGRFIWCSFAVVVVLGLAVAWWFLR